MVAIDQVAGSTVAVKYFAATTDPKASESEDYIKDPAGSAVVQASKATAGVPVYIGGTPHPVVPLPLP